MSGGSSTVGSEADGAHGREPAATEGHSRVPGVARARRRAVVAAGVLAALGAGARTAVGVLYNLPFDPVVTPPPLREGLALAVPAVLALALVAVALASPRNPVRVGLLFAGVFGLLATASPGATLPAVVALAGGGALALWGGVGRPASYRDARRLAVATAVLAGVVVSLSSTTGLVDGGFRGVGATAALAALFGVGVRAEGDRVALAAGTVTALGVVAAGAASPFVLGSALLVEFAVVGAPVALVALALGGATAAAIAGVRRGEYALAAGATLLVFAGVPATLPRALAVLLGATLVLVDADRLLGTAARSGVTA